MLRKYIFQMNDAIAMMCLTQKQKPNGWLSIFYDYSRDVLTQTTMTDDEQNLGNKRFFILDFFRFVVALHEECNTMNKIKPLAISALILLLSACINKTGKELTR